MSRWALYYRLREAREGIARNAWASLATVILLTLTLLLLGGFLWINANLAQVASLLERQIHVRVFPEEGTAASALTAPLEALPGVLRAEVVDGRAVYEQLAPVFGREALMNALPVDAFADSLSVELDDPGNAEPAISMIASTDGVGDVIWGQGYAQVLYEISSGLRRGGVILIAGFFFAAFLTSLTAMHLAILNREAEIEIQRWVGVTPWGIRSQFFVESLLLGLFSSIIAGAAFLYLGGIVERAVAALMPFMSGQLSSPAIVVGIVLVTGPLIALVGGGLASQRAIGLGNR